MRVSNSFAEGEIVGTLRLFARLDRDPEQHHAMRSDDIVSFRRKLLTMRARIESGRTPKLEPAVP